MLLKIWGSYGLYIETVRLRKPALAMQQPLTLNRTLTVWGPGPTSLVNVMVEVEPIPPVVFASTLTELAGRMPALEASTRTSITAAELASIPQNCDVTSIRSVQLETEFGQLMFICGKAFLNVVSMVKKFVPSLILVARSVKAGVDTGARAGEPAGLVLWEGWPD
jgi:hypothetical protein